MPKYRLQAHCPHCHVPHPAPVVFEWTAAVELEPGRPIGDRIEDLPPAVVSMRNNTFTCPATGLPFLQRDNDYIYLERIDDPEEREATRECPVCGKTMFQQPWDPTENSARVTIWACPDRDDAAHATVRQAGDLRSELAKGHISGGPPPGWKPPNDVS
jgi:hypothetical protein